MTRIRPAIGRFIVLALFLHRPAEAVDAAPHPFEEAAPDPEAPLSPADLRPLKLADGQTTPNDRCPVRKRPLSAKIEPVYVNQHPVGFC